MEGSAKKGRCYGGMKGREQPRILETRRRNLDAKSSDLSCCNIAREPSYQTLFSC